MQSSPKFKGARRGSDLLVVNCVAFVVAAAVPCSTATAAVDLVEGRVATVVEQLDAPFECYECGRRVVVADMLVG